MKHMGSNGGSLFDSADGFFYDVLRYPDGNYEKFRGPFVGGPDSSVRGGTVGNGVA